MDFAEAKANLCKLLCCNVEKYSLHQIKDLVRSRILLWHPDKNLDCPGRYKEEFLNLHQSWSTYKRKIPSPQERGQFSQSASTSARSEQDSWKDVFQCDFDDLFTDESSEFDGPFSEEFFSPSPRVTFDIPQSLRTIFRAKSNRRAGKFFCIFSLGDTKKGIDALHSVRYSGQVSLYVSWEAKTDADILVTLVQFHTERRVGDVKKELRKLKIIPNECVYAVHFKECVETCASEFKEPWFEPCSVASTDARPSTKFNHKLMVDFASAHEISDVYQLMHEYAHLGQPCDRSPAKVTNDHEEEHKEHLENARRYLYSADRKKAAKNAVEAVLAKIYTELKTETGQLYIDRRAKEIGYQLLDIQNEDLFGLADYYTKYHFKKFKSVASIIVSAFIFGTPRNRYCILRGDFKCGKTSFANGFLKFFEGVNINVNVDRSRLPFYLGQAIGKRFVLFDDVKGRQSFGSNLTPGLGFPNLDDLRDHLDGHVEVQLEKKNKQPISQIFPPGIITCNDYDVPDSIKERVIGPVVIRASNHWHFHPLSVVDSETIYIGCVLNNILPAEPEVHRHISLKVSEWWRKEWASNCPCLKQEESRTPTPGGQPGGSGECTANCI